MNYTRNFKQMLYHTLKRWVMIVIVVIIAAGAFGAVATMKELNRIKSYEANPAEQQVLIEESESKIAYYESELAQFEAEIASAKKLIQDTDTVQISEALININVIGGEQIDPAQKLEEIKYIYYAVINNVSLYEKISKELALNIPAATLKKLVAQSQNSSSILLSVKGFDREINEQVRAKLVEEIFATEKSLNASLKIHEIDLISQTSTEIKESVYATVFNELDEERDQLETKLRNSKKLAASYQSDDGNAIKQINLSTILIYLIMGGILGFVGAVALSAVGVILDNKIYSLDDVTRNFSVASLGEVKIGRAKKKSIISRLIDRLFGYHQPVFPISNKNPLTDVEAQKLLLIVENKESKEKVEKQLCLKPFAIVEKFSEASCQEVLLKASSEVTETDLEEASDVVLGVVYQKSRFKQLERELAAICALNKNVIGFIGLSVQDGE